jgi:hypothetical protein
VLAAGCLQSYLVEGMTVFSLLAAVGVTEATLPFLFLQQKLE